MPDRATMLPDLGADGLTAYDDRGRERSALLVDEMDFAIVDQLRARVANRLATDESAQFTRLDVDGKVEFTRTLVIEELQEFVLHRQMLGQPVPTERLEDELVEAVVAATGGLGRLEPLLKRTDVEDVFFNGTANTVLHLSDGRKVEGPAIASSDEDLVALLQGLSTSMGDGAVRELSPAKPLLALRLKSLGDLGGRMSAAIDVTPHPAGTIRVHRHTDCDLDTLAELGMIDSPLRAFCRALVRSGAKVCISGGTGFGKTTFLRALASEIPLDKMIVTIEDDRELGVHAVPKRDEQGRVVRDRHGRPIPRRPPSLVRAYEARPANSEGSGAVTMADLSHQALRDSPDVLIVGETRGGEVVQLLDAATSGIAGVMCTIHAASAFTVFERIVQLVRKAQPPLPADYALRACTSLDVIIHLQRNRAHQRFVTEIIEVATGPLNEDGYPRYERIFAPGPDGRAVPTGRALSADLASRLEDVGFDRAWLQPGQSDWAVDAADEGDWP